MSAINKKYIVIFLTMGLTYGLVMFFMEGGMGAPGSPWKFVIMGLFYGLMMSFLLVGLQRYRMKKAGINEDETSLKVTEQRTIQTNLPPHRLMEVLNSDDKLSKFKIKEVDDLILVSTGVTWWSWGEEMTIKLIEVHAQSYEYEVRSTPKLSTTLMDYGKNLENVKMVEAVLLNYRPSPAQGAALDLEDTRLKEEQILKR